MRYSKNYILKNIDSSEFLFFWGHTAKKSSVVDRACLSQWWPAKFELQGQEFSSAEQWMMYQKAILFGNVGIANQILENHDPRVSKALGRQVSNFSPELWDKKKCQIVYEGNLAKFNQNPRLSNFLKSTDNSILVEASPNDKLWGIGMSRECAELCSPIKWEGANLLGFILMEVRDDLF